MNNIIPIKVEKKRKQRYKFIEWKIHNLCNYDCSFCGTNNKDGSERWLTIEEYKLVIDKIAIACKGVPFYIQVTGGEPSLYPKLLEFLTYAKSKGAYTAVITNGSRTMRWWNELLDADVVDRIIITYHSEQTSDYKHIVDVLNLFLNTHTETTCEITHTKDTIPEAFEAYHYIYANTGAYIDLKSMNISDYDIFSLYTSEQLDFIKTKSYVPGARISEKAKSKIPYYLKINSDMIITYNDETTGIMNHQQLLKHKMNNFNGWDCNVGKDFIRIVHDKIFRGICGVGGVTGTIYNETISFTSDFITCNLDSCFCLTDLTASKIQNTNNRYIPIKCIT